MMLVIKAEIGFAAKMAGSARTFLAPARANGHQQTTLLPASSIMSSISLMMPSALRQAIGRVAMRYLANVFASYFVNASSRRW